jgi:hypothetical protein
LLWHPSDSARQFGNPSPEPVAFFRKAGHPISKLSADEVILRAEGDAEGIKAAPDDAHRHPHVARDDLKVEIVLKPA